MFSRRPFHRATQGRRGNIPANRSFELRSLSVTSQKKKRDLCLVGQTRFFFAVDHCSDPVFVFVFFFNRQHGGGIRKAVTNMKSHLAGGRSRPGSS